MLPAVFLYIFALRSVVGLDLGIPKCVAIPQEMSICHDVGYIEMRLPNLMGHTNLAEAVTKSAGWQHLLRTDSHPYARTFCRSLCTHVFGHISRNIYKGIFDCSFSIVSLCKFLA